MDFLSIHTNSLHPHLIVWMLFDSTLKILTVTSIATLTGHIQS